MKAENMQKIRALCRDDALADAILAIIEEDTREHKADLARRQMDGLKRAREDGTQLGRPMIKKPRNFQRVYQAFINHELSARAASLKLNVSTGNFKRWADEVSAKTQ